VIRRPFQPGGGRQRPDCSASPNLIVRARRRHSRRARARRRAPLLPRSRGRGTAERGGGGDRTRPVADRARRRPRGRRRRGASPPPPLRAPPPPFRPGTRPGLHGGGTGAAGAWRRPHQLRRSGVGPGRVPAAVRRTRPALFETGPRRGVFAGAPAPGDCVRAVVAGFEARAERRRGAEGGLRLAAAGAWRRARRRRGTPGPRPGSPPSTAPARDAVLNGLGRRASRLVKFDGLRRVEQRAGNCGCK
jgi:hypothetical protein